MRNVDVLLHRDFEIGVTDKRLFGAFIEHLGRRSEEHTSELQSH